MIFTTIALLIIVTGMVTTVSTVPVNCSEDTAAYWRNALIMKNNTETPIYDINNFYGRLGNNMYQFRNALTMAVCCNGIFKTKAHRDLPKLILKMDLIFVTLQIQKEYL
jgi:hypothetical protein